MTIRIALSGADTRSQRSRLDPLRLSILVMFIYSRDVWDVRRVSPFKAPSHGRMSGWEAVAPLLLLFGTLALFALAVLLIQARGR